MSTGQNKGKFSRTKIDYEKGKRIYEILNSLKGEKNEVINTDKGSQNIEENQKQGFWQRLISK